MITQTFDLNLIPQSEPVIVHVNQYDVGAGRLVVNLYDGDTAYTPATGATVVIQGTKPDGHGFMYNATWSGNTVTANLTDQMTPVCGAVRTQIVVTEGNNVTGTFVFTLSVQKSSLPADTDMSESDYQAIEELIRAAIAASANPPIIGQNGHWWIIDAQTGEYVDSGVDASITVQIADITMLAPDATPYVTNSGTDTDPIFHLYIPRGKGITSIAKTSTSGLKDTYTITYSDGATYTYIVTNGNGIASISKTSTSGLVDTYTITFDNGTTTTYAVANGKGVSSIAKTGTAGLVDTYTITYNDGSTSTYTVTNGKGITNIAKISTVGLDDTYRISYNDGTNTAFTVTNGKSAYQAASEGGYSGTEAEFNSDLANFEYWAGVASAKAAEAYNSASDASDYADMSKSYAVGTNGVTRAGDATDNSKYYSEQAAGAVASANAVLDDVVDAGNDALTAIQNALDNDAPEFEIDFTTGHLMYGGTRFVFQINQTTGHLMWGLTV